ncbi:hypothetical protein ColTof4_08240 [Colletotrichum tofieldiae]|nr:hypothetical protein ColTof3_02239 [Colletotrichum tofieldiae]GKT75817.1 hypothetical protein ColTof4_08240 [Colletotrichum tofieldiae]
MSVLRHPSSAEADGEKDVKSLAWAVTIKIMRTQSSRCAFSGLGDSGACGWDLNSRVAGIVTSGPVSEVGRGAGADVKYVTPIEGSSRT